MTRLPLDAHPTPAAHACGNTTDAAAVCMQCGRTPEHPMHYDSDRRFDGSGGEWWVWWTYCRPCDCWTEHAPADMPEHL